MTLYCPVRNIYVSSLPEEQVRVRLLHELVSVLGFPRGGIAIERELSQMPHLAASSQPLPRRRADIVCFASGVHPQHSLYPLLLIECKAVKLTEKMTRQIVGYNHFLQAPYIALVNQSQVKLGWFDTKISSYQFVPYLTHYKSLMEKIAK